MCDLGGREGQLLQEWVVVGISLVVEEPQNGVPLKGSLCPTGAQSPISSSSHGLARSRAAWGALKGGTQSSWLFLVTSLAWRPWKMVPCGLWRWWTGGQMGEQHSARPGQVVPKLLLATANVLLVPFIIFFSIKHLLCFLWFGLGLHLGG